ncbi:MAG: hypothetical protein AAF585_04740, partial [Verrucomicrobiota bacterium]
KDEAQQILLSDVLVEISAGVFSMGDLGEQVEWSERSQFEADAPLAAAEHDDPHKVLVALADFSDLDVDSLKLRVKDESLQAVIFWVEEHPAKTDVVRRVFLIAGDHSMPVELPKTLPHPLPFIWMTIALIAAVVLAVAWRTLARRRGDHES